MDAFEPFSGTPQKLMSRMSVRSPSAVGGTALITGLPALLSSAIPSPRMFLGCYHFILNPASQRRRLRLGKNQISRLRVRNATMLHSHNAASLHEGGCFSYDHYH
jgi:hypothetical protein